MKTRALRGIALAVILSCWAKTAGAATFSTEAGFLQAVVNPTTESFNQFSVGFLPQTTLQLGDVTVALTNAGSSPIFGPGPFGFTTNFLSASAQEGHSEIVISLPAGTQAAGMQIVSVLPVTLTATYAGAPSETVNFSSSEVAFVGFAHASGLLSITISSAPNPNFTPIVNVGNITYASQLSGPALEIPTLSEIGLLLLGVSLLLAAWRMLRKPARSS